jgi:hypothetical protein
MFRLNYDVCIVAKDHRQNPITDWDVRLVYFPDTPAVGSIRKSGENFILHGFGMDRAFETLFDARDHAQLEMDKLNSEMAVS